MCIKFLTITLLVFQFMGFPGRAFVSASAAVRSANEAMGNGTFLYFGFGSNLLSHRIHIQNPTAVRAGTGKLKVSAGVKVNTH